VIALRTAATKRRAGKAMAFAWVWLAGREREDPKRDTAVRATAAGGNGKTLTRRCLRARTAISKGRAPRIVVTQPAVTWHPTMSRYDRGNSNTRCYCPRTFSGILMAASVIQRRGAC